MEMFDIFEEREHFPIHPKYVICQDWHILMSYLYIVILITLTRKLSVFVNGINPAHHISDLVDVYYERISLRSGLTRLSIGEGSGEE